mmetsp:Transcript_4263/g.11039  ORF Transcript_4263/g.11039 Transcript_4263/m.11039 type:complete len:249 (+) Transcript_4263:1208-1954(+)
MRSISRRSTCAGTRARRSWPGARCRGCTRCCSKGARHSQRLRCTQSCSAHHASRSSRWASATVCAQSQRSSPSRLRMRCEPRLDCATRCRPACRVSGSRSHRHRSTLLSRDDGEASYSVNITETDVQPLLSDIRHGAATVTASRHAAVLTSRAPDDEGAIEDEGDTLIRQHVGADKFDFGQFADLYAGWAKEHAPLNAFISSSELAAEHGGSARLRSGRRPMSSRHRRRGARSARLIHLLRCTLVPLP